MPTYHDWSSIMKPKKGPKPRHTKSTKGRTGSQPRPKGSGPGTTHEKRMTGGSGY